VHLTLDPSIPGDAIGLAPVQARTAYADPDVRDLFVRARRPVVIVGTDAVDATAVVRSAVKHRRLHH
jgi:CO dehydrogenase/acetyl-CoA synthase epsilon subunit